MRTHRWAMILAVALTGCFCEQPLMRSASAAIDTKSIDFGRVFVGGRHRREVPVVNQGRAQLQMIVEELPAGFRAEPPRLAVEPGDTANLTFIFEPQRLGEHSGVARLSGDAEIIEIQLAGVGVEKALDVSKVLDFGPVFVGETRTLELTVANAVDMPLSVLATVGGEDGFAFRVEPASIALPVGGSGKLAVAFNPPIRARYEAELLLETCPTCPLVRVRLTGIGAVVLVRPNPDAVDFGLVSLGRTRTIPLLLENVGDVPATLGSAKLLEGAGPGFSLEASALPSEVPAGEAVALEVSFSPGQERDPQTGTVRVFDPEGEPLFDVPLAGRGGGPDLVVSPSAIDFGVVPAGAAATRVAHVSNLGDRDEVDVLSVRIEGPDAERFSAKPMSSLPADVRLWDLAIEVGFTAPSDGTYAAELIVVSTDSDTPELRVALSAETVEPTPCALEAKPDHLRFGLVQTRITYEKRAELVNIGTTPCLVWDIGINPTLSQLFSVPNPPQSTILAPGETLEVEVAFRSDHATPSIVEGALVFRGGVEEAKAVRLTALASSAQLVAVPNPVDFGQAPLGFTPMRAFEVRNRGSAGVVIERLSFGDDSAPEITFFYSTTGGPLGPGHSRTFRLRYSPTSLGVHQGQVEVWFESIPEALLVDAFGEAIDGPCGELCEPPVATCPGPQVVTVNNAVRLAGAGSHPTGMPVTCEWSVVQRPPGSSEAPRPANACTTTFVPDIVGDYLLELLVIDEHGRTAVCATPIEAQPYGGLWVETYWDLPGDIDLHLLHPSGGDPNLASSWMSTPWDCFYSNMTPSWDGPGTADDPSLDRDDIPGTGPENIRIDAPVIGHRYSVGVHWYSNANAHPSVEVTTNIYCAGQLIHTEITNTRIVKALIVLGDVEFIGSVSCVWHPNGTVVSL
ncbi:MAG: choice-of-anchor D domain-containing protein [Myxococcales bacterium]|jgi:hypothetical protein